MSGKRILIGLAVVAGMLSVPVSKSYGYLYTLTVLASDTPAGTSDAAALNAGGAAVGNTLSSSQLGSYYASGSSTPAPVGTGHTFSFATGINSGGFIVGTAFDGSVPTAFYTTPVDHLTTKTIAYSSGVTSSTGAAINNSNTIAGQANFSNGSSRAYYTKTISGVVTMQVINDPSAQNALQNDYAAAVNDTGIVVGANSTVVNGEMHAFYTDTTVDAVPHLITGSGTVSAATALNGGGKIVGYTNTAADPSAVKAFIYSGGSGGIFSLLGGTGSLAPGDTAIAQGINDTGLVVGQDVSAVTSDAVAFLYNGSSMIDLNSYNTLGQIENGTGWTLTNAEAVNNAGQIVGQMSDSNGRTVGFLLSPSVPEPAAALVIMVSADLFLNRRRRT